MLEPVRQYALERLGETGDPEDARRRHAAFYLALTERAGPLIKGRDQVEWLDRLEAENDNLRAAIAWSLEADGARSAGRLGWAGGVGARGRGRHALAGPGAAPRGSPRAARPGGAGPRWAVRFGWALGMYWTMRVRHTEGWLLMEQ